MSTMQKVIIIGHIGKEPEIRKINKGFFCYFTVATTDYWYNDVGTQKSRTDWHNITIWGKRGQYVYEKVQKGDLVYIEGQIRYTKTEEGQKYTNIIADKVILLKKKNISNDTDQELIDNYFPESKGMGKIKDNTEEEQDLNFDDIPF